jgi:hypothetical protein
MERSNNETLRELESQIESRIRSSGRISVIPNEIQKLIRELSRDTESVELFKKNQRQTYDFKGLT